MVSSVSNILELDLLTGSPAGPGFFYFKNARNPYSTRGFETSIRIRWDDWSLFWGNTYVDARTGVQALPYIPLASGNKIVFDLSKEKNTITG